MNTKHTPGPWHHDKYGHICAKNQIIGSSYQFELDDSDHDELPCLENARLMAAAPELLEIVKAFLGHDIEAGNRATTKAKKLIKQIEEDETRP